MSFANSAARLLAAATLVSQYAFAQSAPTRPTAQALLSRVANHLGGLDALRGVRTLRLQYTTHWFRTSFTGGPSGQSGHGSLEQNVDTRNYDTPAWRQVRGVGAPGNAIVNVIADSVASSTIQGRTIPLSAAYLTERAELFLIAPERLVPRLFDAAAAGKATMRPDTTLNGIAHHAVRADLDGRTVTAWITSDGFLSGVRMRAGQPFDFGLAGFREMDVDVFYAQWRVSSGVAFPGHVAIHRLGQPYKELFVTAVSVNPTVPADSFTVSDSVRGIYTATARKAMFDVTITPVKDTNGIAIFGVPQAMPGALRLRDGWLVIGGGAESIVMERAVASLAAGDSASRAQIERTSRDGSHPGLAVVGTGSSISTMGGLPWASKNGYWSYVSTSGAPFARGVFRQQGVPASRLTVIGAGKWTMVAADSVYMESLDYPDSDGSILLWVPRLSWAYVGPLAGGQIQTRAAISRLDELGFKPARIGTVRFLSRPADEVRREAAGQPSQPARP